jgi:hypothetical protein
MARNDELTAQDDAQFQREAQAAQQALVNWVVQAAATDWSGNQQLRAEVEQRIAAAVSTALETSLPGQSRLVELGAQQARIALTESLAPIAAALTSLRNEQNRLAGEVEALRRAVESLPPLGGAPGGAGIAGGGDIAQVRANLAGDRQPAPNAIRRWWPFAGAGAAAVVAVVVLFALFAQQQHHPSDHADNTPTSTQPASTSGEDPSATADPATDPNFQAGWGVLLTADEARKLGHDCAKTPQSCDYASLAGPDVAVQQRTQLLNDALTRLARPSCKPGAPIAPPPAASPGDAVARDQTSIGTFANCLGVAGPPPPPDPPDAKRAVTAWLDWAVDALGRRAASAPGAP